MLTVFVAGDQFVGSQLLVDALTDELGPGAFVATSLELPWPVEPFGPVAEVDEASGTEEQVIEAVGAAEIAVTQMGPFTRKVFAAAPGLRLVCVCRGGPVNVDLEAASAAGVTVTFTPGRNAPAAAEYAVGMILAALRRIPEASAELKGGQWRGDYYAYPNAGIELAGTTVGLVGYGAAGTVVARVLRAFGARVKVADPFVAAERAAADGVEMTDLDALLRESMVVSLHARLTTDNAKMINARTLSLLPRGAVLVNTARGGLVDYDDLRHALDSGQLAAVALDVYDVEPPDPSSRLVSDPRVICTPHLAGASRQTAHRAAQLVAAEVGRYVRGEALRYVANPPVADRQVTSPPPGPH